MEQIRLSTQFFGSLPDREMHHTSVVVCHGPELFVIVCKECNVNLPNTYGALDLALRAAAYHNTTFKSKPDPMIAPKRHHIAPVETFTWGTWIDREFAGKLE